MGAFSMVVLDFETTGLSPAYGDRVIEVGAVLLRGGAVAGRFQSLANPGRQVSRFIEEYTGISNEMLRAAPPVAEVMALFANFIEGHVLAAHNASFDSRFLDAELARLGLARARPFACTLLLSRRVYPEAPAHNLETLARYKRLTASGPHHRALADAEMAAALWLGIVEDIKKDYGLTEIPLELMLGLAKVAKAAAPGYLKKFAAG
ncbi:MAG: 3'-5' exonuclease [Desulfovibrionaceae bacterium]|nr:3'-5' exonuclease [Desulfovibrionaceae bacterium]MBF0514163.1 3'-5' exonuclease [Desulfovibrionaceae bacterium]